MAKTIQAELLAVLRKYELAGEWTKRKAITNVKEFPARQLSRLVSFVYEKQSYFVLYDTSVADDIQIALDHLRMDIPDIQGNFVRNPLESTMKAYGMPHMGKDVYLFTKKIIKTRLDQEVVRRYPQYTRSTIQKYIKGGYVHLNGEIAQTTKQDVTEHDEIALIPPVAKDTSGEELPIIYIDDNVIVVNKPVGVLTHSKGALNDEFTVADFFRRYTTNALDSTRPGIVHRLDRDTSGIIIGARNDETALMLKKQFADRTTKKQYTAIVDGVPELEKALIDLPIGRNPSAPSKFRVDSKGKPAITSYEMIKTNGTQSLLELRPKTGRTHQLRVHMQYIKTPIAGDRVYGDEKTAKRLCLHAHTLEITIPTSERKVFTAPKPPIFEEMV